MQIKDGETHPYFDDPETLRALILAGYEQLMALIDYLEEAHAEEVSTDPKFQEATRATALYLLWRQREPGLFNFLPVPVRLRACGGQSREDLLQRQHAA